MIDTVVQYKEKKKKLRKEIQSLSSADLQQLVVLQNMANIGTLV